MPRDSLRWSHIYVRLCLPLQEGSWIAARAVIGPGVTVERGAVLTLGGVGVHSLEPMTIYAGNPARLIKQRKILDRAHLMLGEAQGIY